MILSSKCLRILLLVFVTFVGGCSIDESLSIEGDHKYATKNVVLVVIDGPRYDDTWATTNPSIIKHQRALAEEGVFFENFYNDGVTFTLSGHTAITTGRYELVMNNGREYPNHHSIFQQFLSTTRLSPDKSWVIASKAKLHALGNTKESGWRSSYVPHLDTEDREDIETLASAKEILTTYTPKLTLIHFKGPDYYGHANDWHGYLGSIQSTDAYVHELWQFLQHQEYYQNNTTLLVTNDHGRHLDGIGSGFVGHGDGCDGCRHISLLAVGPDFEQNKVVSNHYGQIDIAPTIATLMGFSWLGEGHSIPELIE